MLRDAIFYLSRQHNAKNGANTCKDSRDDTKSCRGEEDSWTSEPVNIDQLMFEIAAQVEVPPPVSRSSRCPSGLKFCFQFCHVQKQSYYLSYPTRLLVLSDLTGVDCAVTLSFLFKHILATPAVRIVYQKFRTVHQQTVQYRSVTHRVSAFGIL